MEKTSLQENSKEQQMHIYITTLHSTHFQTKFCEENSVEMISMDHGEDNIPPNILKKFNHLYTQKGNVFKLLKTRIPFFGDYIYECICVCVCVCVHAGVNLHNFLTSTFGITRRQPPKNQHSTNTKAIAYDSLNYEATPQ